MSNLEFYKENEDFNIGEGKENYDEINFDSNDESLQNSMVKKNIIEEI